MKNVLLTANLCLMVLLAVAQQPSSVNNLSIHFGPSFLARQDLVFSPMIHTDNSLTNFRLKYSRDTTYYQEAAFRFVLFNPMMLEPYNFYIQNEAVTASPHLLILVDLDYTFGKTYKISDQTSYTIGGVISNDVQALFYAYGRIGSFGYYSSNALGITGKFNNQFKHNHNISTSIHLPLICWLARSPYLVNDDTFIENIYSHKGFATFMAFIADGELATLNKWQSLNASLDYQYQINKSWTAGAAYDFEFIHIAAPRNLLSYRNSFMLSAQLNF